MRQPTRANASTAPNETPTVAEEGFDRSIFAARLEICFFFASESGL